MLGTKIGETLYWPFRAQDLTTYTISFNIKSFCILPIEYAYEFGTILQMKKFLLQKH